MPHVLDPQRLDSEGRLSPHRRAEQLMATDPDTPAGRRFDELVAPSRLRGARRGHASRSAAFVSGDAACRGRSVPRAR
jgi:hypothetical protein